MWEGFPLEERDPELAKRMQSRLRHAAGGIFAAAVLLTAASAFIAWKIPHSRDLYNLVYPNHRPYKGEDTYGFLFIFPAFLWGLAILLWFDPASALRRKCKSDNDVIFVCVCTVLGATVFAIVALARDAAAWRYYF